MEMLKLNYKRFLETDEISVSIVSSAETNLNGIDKLISLMESMNSELSSISNKLNNFSSSAVKASNSIKDINQSLSETQSKSKVNINITTSSINTAVRNLESLMNIMSVVENNNSIDFNVSADALNSLGVVLPTSTQRTISSIQTLQSVMSDPSSSDSLKNNISGLLSYLKKLQSETTTTKSKFDALKDSVEGIERSWKGFTKSLTSTAVRFRILTGFFGSIARSVSNVFEKASSYEESINLFTVSLGKYAEKGKKWADEIADALSLDPQGIYQFEGALQSLITGLGVASDKAYTMSTTMTQLAYDMSSYLNMDVQSTYDKLQSGLSGQVKGMRAVGVALTQASLQEKAYSLGIEKSVTKMTEAEKVQLRYIQIMDSTKKMQGDLARTILTPENSIRVIKQQFVLLGRAIGQVFIPIVMKALPLIMAMTQYLTDLATRLAKFLGFTMTPVDYSSLKGIGDALTDIGDQADDSGKKVKNMLAPFDELNVVMSKSGKDNGLEDTIDFSQYIKTYNMLEDLTTSLKEKSDELLPVAEKLLKGFLLVGTALGAVKLISFASDVGEAVKKLKGLDIVKKLTTPLKKFGDTAKKSGSTFSTLFSESVFSKSTTVLGKFGAVAGTVLSTVVAFTDSYKTSLDQLKNPLNATTGDTVKFGLEMGALALAAGVLTGPAGALAVLVAEILGVSEAVKKYKDDIKWEQEQKNIFTGTGKSVEALSETLEEKYGYLSDYAQELQDLQDKYNDVTKSIDDDVEAIKIWHEKMQYKGTEPTKEDLKELSTLYQNLKDDIQKQADIQKDIVQTRLDQLALEEGKTVDYYNTRKRAAIEAIQIEAQATKDYTSELEALDLKKQNGIALTDTEKERYRFLNQVLGDVSGSFDELTNSLGSYIGLQTSSNWGIDNLEDTETKIQKIIDKSDSLLKESETLYTVRKGKIEDDIAGQERIIAAYDSIISKGGELTGKQQKEYDAAKTLWDEYNDQLVTVEDHYEKSQNQIKGTLLDFLSSIGSQLDTSSDAYNMGSKQLSGIADLIEGALDKLDDADVSYSVGHFFKDIDTEIGNNNKTYSQRWTSILASTGIESFNGYKTNFEDNIKKWDGGTSLMDDVLRKNKPQMQTKFDSAGNAIGTYYTQGIAKGAEDESTSATVKKNLQGMSHNMETYTCMINGVNSPSKLYHDEVGVYLTQGIAEGMLDESTSNFVKKSIRDASNNLKDMFASEMKSINVDMNINTNVESSFNTILKKLQTFCNNWTNGVNTLVKNMKNTMNNIKLDSSGKISYTSMPKVNVQQFEDGGYPSKADMFFMNEDGRAEFIASVGGNTAVFNQDQMVNALTNAIVSGFNMMSSNSNRPSTTNVYIGNEKVYSGQGEYQNRQSDRYGTTSTIKV